MSNTGARLVLGSFNPLVKIKLLKADIVSVVVAFSAFLLASDAAAQTPAAFGRSHAMLAVASPMLSAVDSAEHRNRALRLVGREDSAASRQRSGAIVGGILGAAAGFVIANSYAGNHHPACVTVPAGGPCRYLESDNASADRLAGVVVGGAVGAFFGYLLER
ncbi:MAG: hypothetical protein ABI442_01755 [Gemmatimonadaceae bacterium]